MSEKLFWIDTETFGLSPKFDPMIEIGFRVTDRELNTLDEASWLIWGHKHDASMVGLQKRSEVGDRTAQLVLSMHSVNYLFNEAKFDGMRPSLVEKAAIEWIIEHDHTGLPMAGSSIQFDRNMIEYQMPELGGLFHYRNIDISTVKELCRRYRPDLYEKVPSPESRHRVMPDLDATIDEFRFYRNEFLNA